METHRTQEANHEAVCSRVSDHWSIGVELIINAGTDVFMGKFASFQDALAEAALST